jgi:tetratricopeptide (TPR) repeat protein
MKNWRTVTIVFINCCAAPAYSQVSFLRTENSSVAQTQPADDYTQNLLKNAVRQASQYGDLDPRYAKALNDLAAWYRTNHNYAQAESLYRQAVASYEKTLGPENINFTTAVDNLVVVFEEQAKYSEARQVLQRFLAIRETALGPENPLTATTIGDLAAVYSSEGKYREAEALYQRSLTIWEKNSWT